MEFRRKRSTCLTSQKNSANYRPHRPQRDPTIQNTYKSGISTRSILRGADKYRIAVDDNRFAGNGSSKCHPYVTPANPHFCCRAVDADDTSRAFSHSYRRSLAPRRSPPKGCRSGVDGLSLGRGTEGSSRRKTSTGTSCWRRHQPSAIASSGSPPKTKS